MKINNNKIINRELIVICLANVDIFLYLFSNILSIIYYINIIMNNAKISLIAVDIIVDSIQLIKSYLRLKSSEKKQFFDVYKEKLLSKYNTLQNYSSLDCIIILAIDSITVQFIEHIKNMQDI